MKVLGLILEINPFHNGHQHFINEAIKKCNPDIVIAVTSTSFTMRGEVSIISKFDKTNILLDNNVDLVVELPVSKTLNSADYFADATVNILNKFGITDLAFGIEEGKEETLYSIFEIINSIEFNNLLNNNLNNEISYKNSFTDTFLKLTNDPNLIEYLEKPNFTLALQYLKAVSKYNKDINIHPIKRVDNYYQDGIEETYKSAYVLRQMLSNQEDISKYIGFNKDLIKKIDYDKLFSLIKYRFLVDNKDITNIHLITEGIENYISKNLTYNNLDECLNNLCNKKYTKSRFMRIFISVLLNIPKTYDINSEYYRILGFNKKGQKYISTLPESFKKVIKTTLKNDSSDTSTFELNATKLYSVITNNNIYDLEFKIPIKKGE